MKEEGGRLGSVRLLRSLVKVLLAVWQMVREGRRLANCACNQQATVPLHISFLFLLLQEDRHNPEGAADFAGYHSKKSLKERERVRRTGATRRGQEEIGNISPAVALEGREEDA